MPWRKALFKEGEVWAEVDGDGRLVVERGRVRIRYQPQTSAKVYEAGAARVEIVEGQSAVELEGAGKGSGFGSAGTRTAGQAAAAAAHAQEQLSAAPADAARAFTDGACQGNPGPAGSGAVVILPDGSRIEAGRPLGRATNNVGELDAIGLALELLDELGWPAEAPVCLYSDSEYARGVLTKSWKAKANQELIRDLKAALAKRPGVRLFWVAGHVGLEGNERADQLAGMAARGTASRRRLTGGGV